MQASEENVQELFDKIKAYVAKGDIARAERLREELMQMDTIPLGKIVESAELIEEAKLAGIDEKHELQWQDLYGHLSPEEKSALFYSLEEKKIPAKTVIKKQGTLNDDLYFLDEGQVDVIFTKGKEHNLVLQVEKGGFVGEDTFFNMSVCTASSFSRSELLVHVLKKKKVAGWAEETPGLYQKLESYCREGSQYEELFEQKRSEKSRFDRLAVHGRVCAALLDSAMEQTGKQFNATVGDISRGGACFFIKASTKETARALLARPLKMIFAIKTDSTLRKFVSFGRVVRVKFHLENDYSVHVQFAKILEEQKLSGLAAG